MGEGVCGDVEEGGRETQTKVSDNTRGESTTHSRVRNTSLYSHDSHNKYS